MDKLCPFLFGSITTKGLPDFCVKEIVEKKCRCLEDICAWYNENASACSMAVNQSLMAAMATSTLELKASQDKIDQLKKQLAETCVGKPFFI